jgi:hypothetical protein
MSAEIIDLGNRRAATSDDAARLAAETRLRLDLRALKGKETPDLARTWDYVWGDGKKTVAETVKARMAEAAKCLDENEPHEAFAKIYSAQYPLKRALERERQREIAQARRERKARMLARTREELERDLRRIRRALAKMDPPAG